MPTTNHRRLAGRVAFAGVSTFVLAVLALHLLQPELNPLTEAVSFYVHGRGGSLLTIGILALAVGSLCLAWALTSDLHSRAAKIGVTLLGVWGLGALLGGIFPADPPGNWDRPPSLAGMIHGNAALVAFLALPPAALLLARAQRQSNHAAAGFQLRVILAVATAISLALFFASLIPVFVRPGPPVMLGLTERIMLACYAAWLAALAARLAKS